MNRKIKWKFIFIFSIAPFIISCSATQIGNSNIKNNININPEILNFNSPLDSNFNLYQLNELFNKTDFFMDDNKNKIHNTHSQIDENNLINLTINNLKYKLLNIKGIQEYQIDFNTNELGWNNSKELTENHYDYLFENHVVVNLLKNNQVAVFPNINIILEKILKEHENGHFKNLLPNFIPFYKIRSQSWVENIEQQEYLAWIIKLYTNYFNLAPQNQKVAKVKLINVKNLNGAVSFGLDYLDKNNNSLLNQNSKNKLFQIQNFRQYIESPDLRSISMSIPLNEPKVLFNEYLNNVEWNFANNFFQLNNFDDFILYTEQYKRYTAKSFKNYLKKYWQKTIFLPVPEYKKNEDLKYEIDSIEYDNSVLKAQNGLKVNIKVVKIDGQEKIYPWLSYDFNSHQHVFKGYHYTDDSNIDSRHNLWTWSNKQFFGDFSKNPILPEGIDPNNFYEKNILTFVNFAFQRMQNNIFEFNNKKINQTDVSELKYNSNIVEYLEDYLNLDILSYLIGNLQNDFVLGIDKIKVTYLGVSLQKAGIINLKIDFLNKNNQSILNEYNQNKIIELGGFKGFNFQKILGLTSKEMLNKSLDYFLDLNQDNISKIPKWSNFKVGGESWK